MEWNSGKPLDKRCHVSRSASPVKLLHSAYKLVYFTDERKTVISDYYWQSSKEREKAQITNNILGINKSLTIAKFFFLQEDSIRVFILNIYFQMQQKNKETYFSIIPAMLFF